MRFFFFLKLETKEKKRPLQTLGGRRVFNAQLNILCRITSLFNFGSTMTESTSDRREGKKKKKERAKLKNNYS